MLRSPSRSRAVLSALALLAALLEVLFLLLRRFHPFDENIPAVVATSLAATVVYFTAAYLACRPGASGRAALLIVLLAAVAFRVTLLPLPPSLSNDLYRYVWEGNIQLSGHNPYLSPPADPALEALRTDHYHRFPGKEVLTAYGPTTQLLFRLTAALGGVLAFKLASVVFDLGTLLLLMGILTSRGLPPARALLYGWCPLVVLEFAGSGHNDSLPVFLLLLASGLIIGERRSMSIAALAAATMSKWFAGVLAPLFLLRAGWRGLPVFAGVAALLWWPYHTAGWKLLAGAATYGEKWRNNESLYALLLDASGQEALAAGVAAGVLVGLALHLAWQRAEPLRATYLLMATVLLLSPSVFPWYVTWLVPFLCFFPHPAFLLFTGTVLLSYHTLIDFTALGVWRYQPWLVWLEYGPVYALLVWGWWRGRNKLPGTPSITFNSRAD